MNLSKVFIFLGCFFLVIGVLIGLGVKMGIPLGKLPGDIILKGKNFVLHFPIISSLLLSIILTILINLIFYLFRK